MWWLGVFCISKVFEFIDTVFLVLKGRDIILLHGYHHLITMLFCWYNVFAVYNNLVFYFAAINYFVHAIMYTYYAAATLGYRSKIDQFITFIQTFQMIIGLGIIFYSFGCIKYDTIQNIFGIFIYLSFFVLFLHFYYKRYFLRSNK